MRLAHFSDIHVTHFPLSGEFAVKRAAAVVSYSLFGRGRHFEGSDARIAALLRDVDGQQVDHALCTGDLTGVSLDAEFDAIVELFGGRLVQPTRFTCIPGNHDRYVSRSHRSFEQRFANLCEGGVFPFAKKVEGGVTIVGIDATRPTSVIDSSGLVGPAQREKLLQILTDPSLKNQCVVLALHYGLLKSKGQRDKPAHGLRDDLELMALVDRADVTVDLILHGHMHTPYAIRTQRRQIINAGSGTDLHMRCGYNVYSIDTHSFTLKLERREWNRETLRYEAAPDSPLNREYRLRE